MRYLRNIKAFIILSRPANVVIAFLSILLAGYLCGIGAAWHKLLLACLSGALVTAGANAINDFFDLEIDRINKPFRPLPGGALQPGDARFFATGAFVLAVIAAGFISRVAVVITLTSAILLYWYSARLKRTVVWGNLTVAFVTGLAFIYGGVAVGRFEAALIPAAFAFFMHFGREIIKDLEDVAGDRANGARTLPVVHGLRPAQWLVTFLFGLLIPGTLLPYWMGIYGRWYLLVVIAGVQVVLAGSLLVMWMRPRPPMLRRLSAVLKADMLVGLLAIYLGRW